MDKKMTDMVTIVLHPTPSQHLTAGPNNGSTEWEKETRIAPDCVSTSYASKPPSTFGLMQDS
jgi:hypothetical protein